MSAAERKRQYQILTQRYWDCLLGDFKSVLLLVAQAPLIGWLCTLVWGSIGTETPMLFFVLCLSSVWFGCINACREIVKERAILQRERLFGLSYVAYLRSKFTVLSSLGLAQVVLLLMAVEWEIALEGAFLIQLLALWLASLAGTGLGLAISACVGNQERAVLSVPLLIIPQLLFSEMAVPEHLFGSVMAVLEKLMPVRWAFDIFQELAASETSWLNVCADIVVLLLFPLLLGGLSLVGLHARSSE